MVWRAGQSAEAGTTPSPDERSLYIHSTAFYRLVTHQSLNEHLLSAGHRAGHWGHQAWEGTTWSRGLSFKGSPAQQLRRQSTNRSSERLSDWLEGTQPGGGSIQVRSGPPDPKPHSGHQAQSPLRGLQAWPPCSPQQGWYKPKAQRACPGRAQPRHGRRQQGRRHEP